MPKMSSTEAPSGYSRDPTFSQREGHSPIREHLQFESMDDGLKNGLWNQVVSSYWQDERFLALISIDGALDELVKRLWTDYFGARHDLLQDSWQVARRTIEGHFFRGKWYDVYNFLEFIANNYPNEKVNLKFMESCNIVLKGAGAGYSFVGRKVVPIVSGVGIAEIEEALVVQPHTIRAQLECALNLLGDRESPDYRNSIKESISAVEGICKLIAGDDKATLGRALKAIGSKVKLHKDLEEAFRKLYSYTCDSNGIRHSLMEEPNLDLEDARFMLVSCSAFVNYLKSKSTEAGIDVW